MAFNGVKRNLLESSKTKFNLGPGQYDPQEPQSQKPIGMDFSKAPTRDLTETAQYTPPPLIRSQSQLSLGPG